MKKKIAFLSLVILILLGTRFFEEKSQYIDLTMGEDVFLSKSQSAVSNFDFFTEAISYWPKTDEELPNRVNAGVVPHHQLASPMIANLFSKLGRQRVDVVYLLAPNHWEEGKCKVITNTSSKKKYFYNSELFCEDEDQLSKEHAIGIYDLYFDHYLSDPEVVPIIFSNYLTMKEVDEVVSEIIKQKGSYDAVVASVDFSHYLPYEQAKEKDEQTLKLIREKKYQELLALDYKNLDSPESIIIISKIMDDSGVQDFEVVAHENFVTQSDDVSQASTSYYELIW